MDFEFFSLKTVHFAFNTSAFGFWIIFLLLGVVVAITNAVEVVLLLDLTGVGKTVLYVSFTFEEGLFLLAVVFLSRFFGKSVL